MGCSVWAVLGSALPGLQQGSGGNNPRSPREWAGTAAGSHLLWMNVGKGGHANKYIKISCGRPFPVWSLGWCVMS